MTRSLIVIFSLLLSPALTGKVHADLILQFSPTNTVQGIEVNVNDSFTVEIYLAETNGETRLLTQGLLGFGLRSTYNSNLLSATGGNANAAFPLTGNPAADLSVSGQADIFGGSNAPPKASVIHLASFHFIARSAGLTTIRFGDLDPSFSDFTLNDVPNFTDLDPLLFGPALDQKTQFSVQINAVPEPSSLSMVAAIIAFLTLFRRGFLQLGK